MKHISENGLNLIKEFEGFRSKAYYDSVGVLTIGYGSTTSAGFIILPEMTITKEIANAMLLKSIVERYEPLVNKYDSIYNFTQNEFDALCSFCYNIGNIDGLTAKGTRSKEVIADKMLLYVKAGCRTLKGLVTRREKERALFLSENIYFPIYKGTTNSIVDALKSVGEKDVSKERRFRIAEKNNILNYEGTKDQNIQLLDLLSRGVLIYAE